MSKFYVENNSFCTKIYIGTDANGKPKYKKLKAQTEKELEKRVREYKNAMDSGLNILKSKDTLLKWVNHYLEAIENEVMCDNIKESEYKTLKSRLQYFIDYKGGLLAKTRLNDILTSHIQPAVNELYKRNPSTGKNTAKKTIQRYIRALANVFEFARKERAYNFCNPCDDLKIPKNAEVTTRTAINKHTIQLILTTEHRAKLPACIMLLAGLRRGEVTALTWFDIDFKNKIINVNKSYDFKQCETKETKTKAGMRKIPINDYLYQMLLDAKKNSKGTYVVQKVYGGRMTETAWKRLFESYMEALRTADGIDEDSLCFVDECFEEFTAHQLRHTYCSMLQWSGVDIKTAQELMGHSEYGVTANIYTHVDDQSKNNAAMLQDKFIKEFLIS